MGRRLLLRVLPGELLSRRPRGAAADHGRRSRASGERAVGGRDRIVARAGAGGRGVGGLGGGGGRVIAALIAILSMTVIGIPIALAVDRNARGILLLGLAFLYGSGWIFLDLLIVPHWTIVIVTIVAVLTLLLIFKKGHGARGTGHAVKPHWLDIPTLVSIIGFGFFCTGAALWEWDFWAIWGMKARVCLEHSGIDWRFLESRWNAYVHPDYPLLVPFNFDFVALIGGGWSDRWLGLLSVAWAIALLLIVREIGRASCRE